MGSLGIGCGDNSKTCGEGTTDEDGVCTRVGGETTCGPGTMAGPDAACVPICTDGTQPDPGGLGCVIDPGACQDGTVLVGDACIDPAIPGTIDLEEGAEPNGLGIGGEPSLAPAGQVTLGAIGSPAFVLHGRIVPTDHDADGLVDADLDTYLVTTTGPALVHVTADGMHGLVGGFVAAAQVAPGDPLAAFRRLGVTVHGDTATRDLFLPAAGTYTLAIADTRSLLAVGTPAVGAAAGQPPLEYYISLARVALPTPTAVTLGGGDTIVTGTLAGDVAFYAASPGTGGLHLDLDLASSFASGSLVDFTNGVFRQYAAAPDITTMDLAITTGDQAILAVDTVLDDQFDPVAFTLTLRWLPAAR
ncbi:MAG: hypothetical protein NT062_07125 [Proteobacteria bacterium]|nr:hypothetical protein [Pseudomonadota bacterium]